MLDNPPYNLVIHTSPVQDPTNDHYHWHIEFMPKLTKTAGFEWGTGFYINPTPPEEAAKFLREANVEETRPAAGYRRPPAVIGWGFAQRFRSDSFHSSYLATQGCHPERSLSSREAGRKQAKDLCIPRHPHIMSLKSRMEGPQQTWRGFGRRYRPECMSFAGALRAAKGSASSG